MEGHLDTPQGTPSLRPVPGTGLQINSDLRKSAIEVVDKLEWRASPAKGVWRRMLDRDGDEVARATSVVRYDSKASFPFHTHHGGEEFLVLQGIFGDPLTGNCPEGYYIRNPIGSSHEPWTEEDGTIILVKLWQMTEPEEHLCLNTKEFYDKADKSGDITTMKLYSNEKTGETVLMDWWKPGVTKQIFDHFEGHTKSGVEIFLVGGDLSCRGESYETQTWFRFPGSEASPPEFSTKNGCQLWVKTGHLGANKMGDVSA